MTEEEDQYGISVETDYECKKKLGVISTDEYEYSYEYKKNKQ